MKLNHFIKKLLLTSLGLTLTLHSSFGSDIPTTAMAEAEDYATPKRNTETEERIQILVLTEGQKVSKMQAEILTYQRLRNVLEEKFLTFAKRYFTTTDETIIETQWNEIFNSNTPYNDAKKRNIILKLLELFTSDSQNSMELLKLKGRLFDLDLQTKKVPLTRIEESTRQYFEYLFKGCNVTTSWKRGGDQLGCVAEVTLSDGQVLTYFVKTHSGGLRSGHSSAAKLVNPAELLVYKILEGLDVGPQSHFFGRDGQNLYIATLGAGTYLNRDGSITQNQFKEYEYFKEARYLNVQEQLWGALTQLPLDIEFSEEQHLQAEQWINSDSRCCMFVREISKLDLLARLMGLADFQTNPSNYGFTHLSNGIFMVKAIDFRLLDQAIDKFQHDDKDFTAFLRGNGLYHYISADKPTCYALRHRKQLLRVQEANSIINKELKNFEETVATANFNVTSFLDVLTMADTENNRTKNELRQYSDIIISNFGLFRDKIDELQR